jgi:hypothetical protein
MFPGGDREHLSDARMLNPSPGWREAVVVTLHHTLDREYCAVQVPQALQAVHGNRLPALEEAIRRQYCFFKRYSSSMGAVLA